jgi:excisionase family DNA binding protein
MSYTLTQAAEAAKVQRSTVFKWIKAGKVSANKADDGTFRIDPAELHRFLASVSKDTPPLATAKQADTQPDTATDTLLQLMSLRSQVEKLQHIVEMERERSRELREEREAWKRQAERLALPATRETVSQPQEPARPQARGWWPWRRSA